MELFPLLIITLQVLFFIGCGIALVYLIAKRMEDKKKETFEDRDN